MGLIDEIPIPRDMTYEEYTFANLAIEYRKKYEPVFLSSMETCKKYFNQLQESIYVISAYIISYEHAIESLNFAHKQLEKTLDTLVEITDTNLYKIRGQIIEEKTKNRHLAWDLSAKVTKMKKILDIMNEKSKLVVEINNDLDLRRPWA